MRREEAEAAPGPPFVLEALEVLDVLDVLDALEIAPAYRVADVGVGVFAVSPYVVSDVTRLYETVWADREDAGLLAGVCLRVMLSVQLPSGSIVARGADILLLSFMVAQVVVLCTE